MAGECQPHHRRGLPAAPREEKTSTMTILESITSPADLKSLSYAELEQLAADIREEMIRVLTVNGGHLGANLGTVELSIALHYVFK